MQRLHLRNRAAGKQAADVEHFVGLTLSENALQAARAGPLLDDEGDGERAFHLCGIEVAQHFDERGITEAVADRQRRHFVG